MSKRILDFDYQLCRIFGYHIFDCDQPTTDGGCPEANGVYDIIICHREGIQDRYDELKTYTKPTTHLIIDTTVESGNIDSLLDTVNHICKTAPYRVTLIIDTDMSDYLENNKVSFECIHGFELAFFAHTNHHSDSKIFLRVFRACPLVFFSSTDKEDKCFISKDIRPFLPRYFIRNFSTSLTE